jgi:hypothetical protein
MLERKGGNWLPFNAQLDLSTTKALISKSVINPPERKLAKRTSVQWVASFLAPPVRRAATFC